MQLSDCAARALSVLPSPTKPTQGALEPYIQIVGRLATRHEAVRVPLQKHIDRQVVEVPPEKGAQVRGHPYLWTHARIAPRRPEATGLER